MADKRAFTLVEMIIYVAVVSSVIVGIVVFGFSVMGARAETYAVQEVQANMRASIGEISRQIRGAKAVHAFSSFGTDLGYLTVIEPDNSLMVIYLSAAGSLNVWHYGVSGPVQVTSSDIRVTKMRFTDLTPPGARHNIAFELTLDFAGNGSVEYAYSDSVKTAVSMRQ